MLTSDQIAELREMLSLGEEQPWIEHNGGGRPNDPTSYVEVETRDGTVGRCSSAFVPWLWADPVEKDDPEDVMRWRFAKEPPSRMLLATKVPELLENIATLQAQCERQRVLIEETAKAAADVEIAKYTGHYRSDDDIRFGMRQVRNAVVAALAALASLDQEGQS